MRIAQRKLGPADHGRPVTAEELADAEYVEGFRYEVVNGLLEVSLESMEAEIDLENWLLRKMEDYEDRQQDLIVWTANNAQVEVPTTPQCTVLKPDLALYQFEPIGKPLTDWMWRDVSPLIVAEIAVDGNKTKDFVRNVDLYFQVPSVAEYWVLDGREGPENLVLTTRRRHGGRWWIHEVPYGETYTTRTLPEFELLIDPRR
jgi:Uma2 family endonuclease